MVDSWYIELQSLVYLFNIESRLGKKRNPIVQLVFRKSYLVLKTSYFP
jgi:hypothetical protein